MDLRGHFEAGKERGKGEVRRRKERDEKIPSASSQLKPCIDKLALATLWLLLVVECYSMLVDIPAGLVNLPVPLRHHAAWLTCRFYGGAWRQLPVFEMLR